MGETWFSRDLPVLSAIIELDEEPDVHYVSDQLIVERTGFDEASVRASLKALAFNDQPFAAIETASMAGDYMITGVTGHARRTVGQWPSPKTGVEEQVAALVAALQQAEDEAPDEASKSKIRKVADAFTSLPAQLAGAVSTAALLKLSGMG